ncbi:MAG: hypothetical protein ABIQ07_10985 [Ginsengibacter sp.]
MELDELKFSWEALSEKFEKQQKLNSKLIEQMTNQTYRNRLNTIARPESVASLFTFIAAIYLVFNFSKLDTFLLQTFGGLSVLFLIVLPVLSLKSIRGLRTIKLGLTSYANTLKEFAVKKIRFQKFQKLNVAFSFLFMIVFAPVSVKLLAGKDISQSISFWLIVVPVSAIFLFFFSRWTLKHYDNALQKAEELLHEVESENTK